MTQLKKLRKFQKITRWKFFRIQRESCYRRIHPDSHRCLINFFHQFESMSSPMTGSKKTDMECLRSWAAWDNQKTKFAFGYSKYSLQWKHSKSARQLKFEKSQIWNQDKFKKKVHGSYYLFQPKHRFEANNLNSLKHSQEHATLISRSWIENPNKLGIKEATVQRGDRPKKPRTKKERRERRKLSKP